MRSARDSAKAAEAERVALAEINAAMEEKVKEVHQREEQGGNSIEHFLAPVLAEFANYHDRDHILAIDCADNRLESIITANRVQK